MSGQLDFEPLKDLLKSANSVLLLIPEAPQIDEAAAALALMLSFKKMDLAAQVGCASKITVKFNRLFSIDKITNKIGQRNLIISFDYIKDSIEKVSYNIKNDKFNLVVEPKKNAPTLDPSKVEYSRRGAEADLMFILGAKDLTDLGDIYEEEKKAFDKADLVNISCRKKVNYFGKVNLVDKKKSSVSEIVGLMFKQLKFPIDADIATNLLAGIESGSDNFTSAKIQAESFKLAGFLMEQGAIKNHLKTYKAKSQLSSSSQTRPDKQVKFNQKSKDQPARPSPDWYRPKVYKGNTQF